MLSGSCGLCDVTLRDGNQALKNPLGLPGKESLFQLLLALGVKQMEVGFPKSSNADYECVSHLAALAPRGVRITALARAVEVDIARAATALKSAKEATICLHTFMAMSPFHMANVLRKTPEEVRRNCVDMVRYAKQEVGPNGLVQFSAEHFGDCRDNLDWVIESFLALVDAGADIINLPNTVERYRPMVFVDMVRSVCQAVGDRATIAVHAHGDLGMATATTIESYFAGARQLEVTVNSLGERAGNANLWEVAVALHCNGVNPGIDLSKVYETALAVAEITGIAIPPNAPLVGRDVFKHRSGIHQHGALRTEGNGKGAYRPIDPQLIGRVDAEELEFTAQSGSAALSSLVREGGYRISEEDARILCPALVEVAQGYGVLLQEELVATYQAYLHLLTQKSDVQPDDLLALAKDVVASFRGGKNLELIKVFAAGGNTGPSMAQVDVIYLGQERHGFSEGDGQVDAIFQALRSICGRDFRLASYRGEGVTQGQDAQGEVHIGVALGEESHEGVGVDTNLTNAAAKAIVHAINQFKLA